MSTPASSKTAPACVATPVYQSTVVPKMSQTMTRSESGSVMVEL
jgi:hypothetical protein